ncbi:hypothetical protein FRX31_026125 [Thalictrum thalictroides]|uniref:Uncharacterized protein n=1 Tax=Thalictrum thalictroides TaxID=46969 RepID=A0A7J6VJA6_THATH|nr:hypothetical protein FRX31_026125 [Thalictrum thalictroides]
MKGMQNKCKQLLNLQKYTLTPRERKDPHSLNERSGSGAGTFDRFQETYFYHIQQNRNVENMTVV